MAYPAWIGRNVTEILRVIDALQISDQNDVFCPINWLPGDDVIISPDVSTEEAQKKFHDIRTIKP
jgi:alkyl hydroperoxide reductase subunit AhpC